LEGEKPQRRRGAKVLDGGALRGLGKRNASDFRKDFGALRTFGALSKFAVVPFVRSTMKSRILLPLCLLLCLAYVYQVRDPLKNVGGAPAPLLLLLHGYGANVDDLFSFAPDLPADYRIVSLQAPIDLGRRQFAWYPLRFEGGRAVADESRAQAAVDYIHGFLDFLKAKYPVDAQRIYLMGFSQGTILSYAVALLHPGEIRGVAGFSGRMLESIRPEIKPDNRHRALRVFVTHGTEDQVIPLSRGKEAVTYLQGLGVQPTFLIYHAAHTILPKIMEDMLAWLAEDK
jgi:phospholipase/carboxylesterase